NLLSVGASFGVLVLVFQDGFGSRWLGLANPTGSVFPIIPVLVFSIVFGLSMDYEVILVARVAEARRGGLGEAGALAQGVSRARPPSWSSSSPGSRWASSCRSRCWAWRFRWPFSWTRSPCAW